MAELLAGIETGESPHPRRKSGVNTGMARSQILRELAGCGAEHPSGEGDRKPRRNFLDKHQTQSAF
jgi:hypothetical protein